MMNQPNEDHKKTSAPRLQPASRERHARQQDEVTSVNASGSQLLSLQLDDIVAADPALQALRVFTA